MLTYFWREMICPRHVRLAAQLAASRDRVGPTETGGGARERARRSAIGAQARQWVAPNILAKPLTRTFRIKPASVGSSSRSAFDPLRPSNLPVCGHWAR